VPRVNFTLDAGEAIADDAIAIDADDDAEYAITDDDAAGSSVLM